MRARMFGVTSAERVKKRRNVCDEMFKTEIEEERERSRRFLIELTCAKLRVGFPFFTTYFNNEPALFDDNRRCLWCAAGTRL